MIGEAAQSTAEAPAAELRRLSTGDVAWLVAIPCALALVAALVLLGPLIASALSAMRPHTALLPDDRNRLAPEPRETAGYLIALGGAALLALAIAAAGRGWRRRPPPSIASSAVLVAQLSLVGFAIACLAFQHRAAWSTPFFTLRTLAVAVVLAAGIAIAAGAASTRLACWRTRETAAERWLVLAVAATLAALWLLPAINTERSIAWSLLQYDTAFPFDETFAVLNGLTPLVSFNAQYASLLPYAIALSLLAFGKTLLVFTIAMCALGTLAMLAVYGVLRRAAGRALLALLLFVPFLATTLFDPYGFAAARFTAGMYFPMIPLRLGGAYLLAWALARHLGPERRTRAWPLFVLAGLVAVNNTDFGLVALAATIVALLVVDLGRPHRLAQLLASAAIGLAVAAAAVAALTLVRAHALPDVAAMSRYGRLYGLAGFSAAPIPAILGLPLVLYVTYAAAIGTAVVRAIDHAPNRVLTGMLAWSGVFGLGAASYWVARSGGALLPLVLSPWALSLALLALAVLETMASRGTRRPSLPGLAVLFALGLMICSIAQAPMPWRELQRLEGPPKGAEGLTAEWSAPPSQAPAIRRFFAATPAAGGRLVLRPGAPVALFATTGHRLADAYGVRDVVPFTGADSMHTLDDFEGALDVLRAAGGRTVLLQAERVATFSAALERRGFRIVTREGRSAEALVVQGLTKWVDTTRRPRS